MPILARLLGMPGSAKFRFKIYGNVLNRVERFKYLGRWLSQDDSDARAVRAQLVKARRVWARMGGCCEARTLRPRFAACSTVGWFRPSFCSAARRGRSVRLYWHGWKGSTSAARTGWRCAIVPRGTLTGHGPNQTLCPSSKSVAFSRWRPTSSGSGRRSRIGWHPGLSMRPSGRESQCGVPSPPLVVGAGVRPGQGGGGGFDLLVQWY